MFAIGFMLMFGVPAYCVISAQDWPEVWRTLAFLLIFPYEYAMAWLLSKFFD